MKAHFPIFVLLLLLAFAVAIDARAAELVVTKIEDTNDGVCDSDCSLREAVVAAAAGDTVVFSTLFNTPQTITLTLGQMNVAQNLTITGTGQNLITISGNNASRIFFINGVSSVTMAGMKLRDGKVVTTAQVYGVGGAIRMIGGNLNLSNMELAYNTAVQGDGGAVGATNLTMAHLNVHHNASFGSAIAATSANVTDSVISDNTYGISAGTLNISNSTIRGNSLLGVSGGFLTLSNSEIRGNGRGVSSGDVMVIENSIIAGNTPDAGLSNTGFATIRNTIIRNNQIDDSGGGIRNIGTMYIINTAILDNLATLHGGGIANHGDLFLTNSTVSGNTANGGVSGLGLGGGIYARVDSSSHLTVTNSTISNNQCTGQGGGIRQDDLETTTIRNTIIAGNISTSTNEEDVSGTFTSQGNNLIGNSTGSSGWIALDLLNVNPFLGPLGNNGNSTFTHALLPNSPAINAGNNSLAVDPQTMLPLKTDQRGSSRFSGGTNQTVDIGAYEASYSSSPVTVSGRITTYSGRGIDRTRIKLDDGNGNIRYGLTNAFGYYRFNNLIPGTTYTITVTHKSSFLIFDSPQFFTADQNRSDLNFMTGLA